MSGGCSESMSESILSGLCFDFEGRSSSELEGRRTRRSFAGELSGSGEECRFEGGRELDVEGRWMRLRLTGGGSESEVGPYLSGSSVT